MAGIIYFEYEGCVVLQEEHKNGSLNTEKNWRLNTEKKSTTTNAYGGS